MCHPTMQRLPMTGEPPNRVPGLCSRETQAQHMEHVHRVLSEARCAGWRQSLVLQTTARRLLHRLSSDLHAPHLRAHSEAQPTGKREKGTVLKYSVEVVLPRTARLLGMLEPVRAHATGSLGTSAWIRTCNVLCRCAGGSLCVCPAVLVPLGGRWVGQHKSATVGRAHGDSS